MTTREILSRIARAYGLEPALLTAKNPRTGRTRQDIAVSHPRQLAAFILVDLKGRTLHGAGSDLGLSHTTVLYGVRKIRRILASGGPPAHALERFLADLQIEKKAPTRPRDRLLLPEETGELKKWQDPNAV
ncbi:MAG: hypothetical protein EPO08_20760 [Rhodospirillaceae bacterium]|nr:MAG: hypothetical protein EPO08_20760 [Rhodospirillaceae bacterium]